MGSQIAELKKGDIIKEIDGIKINKFSDLHDGKNIIFCKTDFLSKEFENISNLPNDVVLITGNSDYPIDHHKFNKRPKNIKKWYAQNSLVHDDILVPLPIGIENKLPSVRGGHGIGYLDRVTEKENLLSRELNVTPTKNIYANFNINTNDVSYIYSDYIFDLMCKENYIKNESLFILDQKFPEYRFESDRLLNECV